MTKKNGSEARLFHPACGMMSTHMKSNVLSNPHAGGYNRFQISTVEWNMKFFGDFEFDEVSMKLSRSGQKVRLTGQALGLLVLLLERAGEVVTREDIQRKLWPDSSVEFEHSID